jgi:hypothetical protein
VSMCVAFDIDATGLDPEDNELPVHLRSPKASQPNTVMSSTLAKEKRMPFFKKVNVASTPVFTLDLSLSLSLSVRPHSYPRQLPHCGCSASPCPPSVRSPRSVCPLCPAIVRVSSLPPLGVRAISMHVASFLTLCLSSSVWAVAKQKQKSVSYLAVQHAPTPSRALGVWGMCIGDFSAVVVVVPDTPI